MLINLHHSLQQSIDSELTFEFDNYYYTIIIKHLSDVFPETKYLLKLEELSEVIKAQLSEGHQWKEDVYVNLFSYNGENFSIKTITIQLEVFHGVPSSFFRWDEVFCDNKNELNTFKNLQPFHGYFENKKEQQRNWKN